MHRRFSIGVLATFLAITRSDPSLADASWISCVAAPTRGCVLDRALEVSRESGGWRVSALIAIAEAQAVAASRLQVAAISDEAVEVLSATHEEGRWRATALGRLAAAQARAGLAEKAHAVIGQALQIIQSVGEVGAAKESDLVKIARDQAEAGNFEEALRVQAFITSKWLQAEVIAAMARAQAKAGRFAEALRLAGTIASEDTGELLKSIADEQVKSWLRNEASSTLAEAARLAISRAHWIDDGHVKLLVSIASSQAKLDLISEARHTFDAALEASQSIQVAINMMPPPIVQRIDAVIDVAEAEARLGMAERAAAAFAFARQLTDSIAQEKWRKPPYDNALSAQHQWRAYAFAAIANGQSRAGLVQDANMTIELALQLVQTIDDRVPPDLPSRARVLSLIASAAGECRSPIRSRGTRSADRAGRIPRQGPQSHRPGRPGRRGAAFGATCGRRARSRPAAERHRGSTIGRRRLGDGHGSRQLDQERLLARSCDRCCCLGAGEHGNAERHRINN